MVLIAKHRARYGLLIALLLSACYKSQGGSTDLADGAMAEDGDSSLTDSNNNIAGFYSSITLDTLTASQSRTVCEQATERIDPCLKSALQTETKEQCDIFERSCSEREESVDRYALCDTISYGEEGTCSITPQQYFNCIDAFKKVQTCDNAGKVIVTPVDCRKVVKQCDLFRQKFGTPPEEVESCPSTEDERGDTGYDADIYGADRCFATPSRFVVLGDSVSKCVGGWDDDCNCSWRILASYIRDTYAPDLVIEGCYPGLTPIRGNIRDVAEDAKTVMGGPGHIIVWISAIGWDLLDLRESVDETESDNYEALDKAIPVWLQDWQKLFDYFTDKSVFPDGVTFMLNTIYSFWDQCPDTESGNDTLGFGYTRFEENAIQYANDKVILSSARERTDTIALDVYPGILGHGHNYDVSSCPYYSPDNAYWFSDPSHLNALGYRHVASQWKRAADRIYKENCRY